MQKEKKLKLKLNFSYELKEIDNFKHRSGWKNVIKELYKINNLESNNEILLIDIIEKDFSWNNYEYKYDEKTNILFNKKTYAQPNSQIKINDKKELITLIDNNTIIKFNNNTKQWKSCDMNINDYSELKCAFAKKIYDDWIGIWHNPPNMPDWFDYISSPQMIMKKSIYLQNINKCKGIIVLSNYLATWLRENCPSHIPISVLYHPTDICNIQFDYNKFLINEQKFIIQIGYWLRKMCAIGHLKTNKYKKIWLYGIRHAFECLDNENKIHKQKREPCSQMMSVIKTRVDDATYDKLLSENICFMYLYDSSANNAIIECIARNTPLLINKHPAVIEYLGTEYPFYYSSIEEAEIKMHNFDLIKMTNNFMKNNVEMHSKISYERFISDFMNCEVIKNCEKIDL